MTTMTATEREIARLQDAKVAVAHEAALGIQAHPQHRDEIADRADRQIRELDRIIARTQRAGWRAARKAACRAPRAA